MQESSAVVFYSLFFVQGDEAIEWIDDLDSHGPDWVIRNLDAAGALEGEPRSYDFPPFGTRDRIIEEGGYVISVSAARGYLGVGRWA